MYALKGFTLDTSAVVKFRMNFNGQIEMDTLCSIKSYCKFLYIHEHRIIADNCVYEFPSGDLIQQFKREKDKLCSALALDEKLLLLAARNQEFSIYAWNGEKYDHSHTVKFCQRVYTGDILLLQKSLYEPGAVFYYLFQKQIVRMTLKSIETLHETHLEDVAHQNKKPYKYFMQIGPDLIYANDCAFCYIINTKTKENLHKFEHPPTPRHFLYPQNFCVRNFPFLLCKSGSDLRLLDVTSNKEMGMRSCRFDFRPVGAIQLAENHYKNNMDDTLYGIGSDQSCQSRWEYFMIKDTKGQLRFIRIKLGPDYRG